MQPVALIARVTTFLLNCLHCAIITGALGGLFTSPAVAADTRLVSVADGGGVISREPNGELRPDSRASSASSDDGRYTVFISSANNLTDNITGNDDRIYQVYRHDALTDTVEAVSANAAGELAIGGATQPSVSADGQWIVFLSAANNLLPLDSNVDQVYLRNMATGTLTLVSSSNTGAFGNNDSRNPVISGDGSTIAFTSFATNLVADNLNALINVYVYNRAANTTSLVSKTSAGVGADENSDNASISDDGTRIAFDSQSTNLIPEQVNSEQQVYLANLTTNEISIVSTSATNVAGDSPSDSPLISGNGLHVAFRSEATDLIAGVTGRQLYLKNLTNDTLQLVSQTESGEPSNGFLVPQSVTADASEVLFSSTARNLVPGKNVDELDFFLADTQSGVLQLQRTSDNRSYNNGNLNRTGTHLVLSTSRTTFVGPILNTFDLLNRTTNTATTIQANPHQPRSGNSESTTNSLLPLPSDGSHIVFESFATNLVSDGSNDNVEDIYLYTEQSDSVELLFSGREGAQTDLEAANADGSLYLISSSIGDLVPNDTNSSIDLFLLNSTTGDIQRVSTNSNGDELATGSATGDLSGNGQFLLFTSAENLVGTDPLPPAAEPLYLKNLLTGEIQHVDRATDGGFADQNAVSISIDGSGRFVAFTSQATNIGGPIASFRQAYLFDANTGAVRALTQNRQGEAANSDIFRPEISQDGRSVSVLTTATNLTPADSDLFLDVFLIDVTTNDIELISKSSAGETASTAAFGGSLSADGEAVVFTTDAINVHPAADGDREQVYLRDRRTGTTELVSIATDGTPANDRSSGGAISGNGLTIAFTSESNNLDADTNRLRDVYRHRRSADTTQSPLFSSVLPSSRTATVASPFSVFVTIIASTDLTGCRLRLGTALGATMTYAETDPLSNEIIGATNDAVDLSAGLPRSFVVSISPSDVTPAQELPLQAYCESGGVTDDLPGINTLAFSVTEIPSADVIALAATSSDDGTVTLPSDGSFGAFAVASINLGANSSIIVRPNISGATLSDVLVCETNPITGDCLSPAAPQVSLEIAPDATPTFSVFARSDNDIPFDPGSNRIALEFLDDSEGVRGRTSVAVQR